MNLYVHIKQRVSYYFCISNMFTRGFKRFCTNATRRNTCSTTPSTTIGNGGNAYKSHRNGGSKNTGFGGPTGYANIELGQKKL